MRVLCETRRYFCVWSSDHPAGEAIFLAIPCLHRVTQDRPPSGKTRTQKLDCVCVTSEGRL
jgi:hypothetical protein